MICKVCNNYYAMIMLIMIVASQRLQGGENVVDCVVCVHYTKYLVDYTTDWSGISRNGGSTCRTCTVLYCIVLY